MGASIMARRAYFTQPKAVAVRIAASSPASSPYMRLPSAKTSSTTAIQASADGSRAAKRFVPSTEYATFSDQ